jgi:hypothetical protein
VKACRQNENLLVFNLYDEEFSLEQFKYVSQLMKFDIRHIYNVTYNDSDRFYVLISAVLNKPFFENTMFNSYEYEFLLG